MIFVSTCLILIILACSPFAMAYLPERSEHFIALGVLGEEGLAEKYYPRDDPNIKIGEEVQWNVYLYNHMGETQYVAVRVKLLNSTMSAPNSTLSTPSPAPVIFEIKRFLLDNETFFYHFSWSIKKIDSVDNVSRITSFSANNEVIKTDCISKGKPSYRIIFELWTYDETSKDFMFSWILYDDICCSWNQIWFTVTY